MQVPRIVSRLRGLNMGQLPPQYLAPSLHRSVIASPVQSSSFSSTAPVGGANPRRDKSKNRGVSAIHRTGPRNPLVASRWPLPKPVSPENMQKRETDKNHGLWAFFPPTRAALPLPEYDNAHGRPWAIQELRERSWEDLHALWHSCVRERNRIATSDKERSRLKAGYGDYESQARDGVIRSTMKNIKHVLRERWYAYEDATRMYERGYRPKNFYGLDETEKTEAEEPATEQMETGQMATEQMTTEQMTTEQMATEQMATEQMATEQMDNEQTAEQTDAKQTDTKQTDTKQTDTGDEQVTENPRKKWFWF